VYRAKGSKFGMAVFDAAMDKILRRNRLNSIHDLNKISYRRDLHDDITIVNVDLQELRKSLNNSK
jgi:hypothetical protein